MIINIYLLKFIKTYWIKYIFIKIKKIYFLKIYKRLLKNYKDLLNKIYFY